MIFFNPVLLSKRGEIRTLHPVERTFKFLFCGDVFVRKNVSAFFLFNLLQS
jgi:hypothetical protein